ncbi:hypothetical protein GWN42_12290 [candidate division KSB1 bacterium]|nr:hypothetical protein [candidate division KSB1 bacterium]NIS23062.1 hypothetical protein [candidate division KSB1 bacterium]NIU25110.1 hypothetical protein [candidate division KSB1 bacterium]NIU91489.1 hypothetical protein [candidate division KSB1 bacterium]NIV93549.1 hypothetical protein [candidate division KSB1 bacterium]
MALLEKNSGTILVIAGGSNLVRSHNETVQELVDISSLRLNYIKEDVGLIRVGATTPIQELIENPKISNLSDGILTAAAFQSYYSRMIRNVATIGGELVQSNPLSVLYCALLVLQAQVRIAGGEEFALAMNIFLNKKGLNGGLLVEVLIPKMADRTYAALSTIQPDPKSPPIIAACSRLTLHKGLCRNVKIGVTATAKIPQRMQEAEIQLEEQRLSNANIESAAETVYDTYQPISDHLAGEEYRKEVVRLVVKKALNTCLELAEEDL